VNRPVDHHRILVVDDNPAIHEDFRKILLGHQATNPALDAAEAILFDDPAATERQHRATFVIDSAHQGHEALEKVTQAMAEGRPYAVAFVDVRMPPGWDGIETISRLWEVAPGLQVVVCTAYSDYSWDKMTAKLGVSDNLVLLKKPFDNVEVLQLSHALTKKWVVTGQAQLRLEELERMVANRTKELEFAYSELRVSEERFSQAFRNSPMPQAIQTLRAHRFVDVNASFLAMTGFDRNEVLGRTPLELRLCIDYEARFLAAARDGRVVHEAEATISTRNGELRQVLLSLEPLSLGGEPHVLLMMQDISDRLTLETQLRQSQKMEAIGQLAAGVAHDFNNLLTIIQGHASLHLDRPHLTRDINASLHQINGAAERAADLTRKLLTFSRRGMVRPKVLDLKETINAVGRMLRRLLGERIQLKNEFADGMPHILADATSIEQVLMNLTLNARDAMPDGGTITIGAEHITIPETGTSRHVDARAGSFIRLSVRDTGTGMDEPTRSRIFEPFFTTKGLNKGTGMGLATVYGIVKQHDGWIEVETKPGDGSTFSVFLPSTERPIEREPAPTFAASADDGNHTIFVVEDDAAVRSLVVEVLQSFNYNVIEAESGDMAISIWPNIRHKVDLLLTDMVMPGKANGLDVARHCQGDKPELNVIYTSGYSSELFDSNVNLQEGVNYLPKPYLSGKLTEIIQRALQASPTGST
jgi:two-component system, cell cycle sensor histidine kinase and response regulator CckA